MRAERPDSGAQDRFVAARKRNGLPGDLAVTKVRGARIGFEAVARNGFHIGVQQAARKQLANEESHAACRGKLIHVGGTIGIDAAEERYMAREIGEILPVDRYAGGTGDGDEVNGVI